MLGKKTVSVILILAMLTAGAGAAFVSAMIDGGATAMNDVKNALYPTQMAGIEGDEGWVGIGPVVSESIGDPLDGFTATQTWTSG